MTIYVSLYGAGGLYAAKKLASGAVTHIGNPYDSAFSTGTDSIDNHLIIKRLSVGAKFSRKFVLKEA